ncbi:MAG: hypothetical protein Q9191_005014 [Dirinaria sp. TL-2023a]
MAAAVSLSELCATLTDSLTSASTSLLEPSALAPPPEGISLLDIKNELLLSYLQNLVFFIIHKLRQQGPQPAEPLSDDAVVQNLVALRVYLEKGVRPLETRLKYQIDKLLLAAADDSASKAIVNGANGTNTTTTKAAATGSASEEEVANSAPPKISDLSYRPNPSAFRLPDRRSPSPSRKPGVYRPPQVTPVAPPDARKDRRPRKSHALNEFVSEELEDAPLAEPSIGAGSGLRGRTADKEADRRRYEEERLVRLPREGKVGGKRRRDVGEGFGEDDLGFGGELNELVKGAKKRKKVSGGEAVRVGEAWEKRKRRGLGKRRKGK